MRQLCAAASSSWENGRVASNHRVRIGVFGISGARALGSSVRINCNEYANYRRDGNKHHINMTRRRGKLSAPTFCRHGFVACLLCSPRSRTLRRSTVFFGAGFVRSHNRKPICWRQLLEKEKSKPSPSAPESPIPIPPYPVSRCPRRDRAAQGHRRSNGPRRRKVLALADMIYAANQKRVK